MQKSLRANAQGQTSGDSSDRQKSNFVQSDTTTKDRRAAANMGLAKAGGQWLIERLCFLFTLVLGDSEVL